jgi:hypothetical protein
VKRRQFVQITGLGTALAASSAMTSTLISSAAWAMGRPRPTSPPRSPFDTPTFRAFIDTVVPGQASDPTGAPGSIEAGAFDFLEAVEKMKLLPVSLHVVQLLLSQALAAMAVAKHLRPFWSLTLEQRTRIVAAIQNVSVVPMPLLLRLMRAPFYTGAINHVGFDYLGYPGPNSGYVGDFSFGQALSWPEPGSVGGNLP